jgi:hypothetical protein
VMSQRPDVEVGAIRVNVHSMSPSRAALAAAVSMAEALGRGPSGIRVEFAQTNELMQLAALPCAREVTSSGRIAGPVDLSAMQRQMRQVCDCVEREIGRLAQSVRREGAKPLPRPFSKFARTRPAGSVMALAEAFTPADVPLVEGWLKTDPDLMGVLVAGPRASRSGRRIAIGVEDLNGIEPILTLLRGRLLHGADHPPVLVFAADAPSAHRIATQGRSLSAGLGPWQVTIIERSKDPAAGAAIAIDRLGIDLLVAVASGPFAPSGPELARLVAAISCPLLLLR